MLIKLEAAQIAERWDGLSSVLKQSLPVYEKIGPLGLTNILASLMHDKMQYWILHKDGIPVGGMLSSIGVAVGTLYKTMIIYCMFGDLEGWKEQWNQSFDVIFHYAKFCECVRVEVCTNNDTIKTLCHSVGINSDQSLLVKEI